MFDSLSVPLCDIAAFGSRSCSRVAVVNPLIAWWSNFDTYLLGSRVGRVFWKLSDLFVLPLLQTGDSYANGCKRVILMGTEMN